MKVRFIIIAVLLALRLYGADSNLIKAATAVGMTITAFSILYRLIRGREKRPMGGNIAFWGIFFSVFITAGVYFYKLRTGGVVFYLFPIIFVSLGIFALSMFMIKAHNRLAIFLGGLMSGGAVSLVALSFLSFFLLGITSGEYGNLAQSFCIASLPFSF